MLTPKQTLQVTITLDVEVDDSGPMMRDAVARMIEHTLAFPTAVGTWLGMRVVAGSLKVAGRDGLTFRNLLL